MAKKAQAAVAAIELPAIEEIAPCIEALLFSVDRPIPAARVAVAAGLAKPPAEEADGEPQEATIGPAVETFLGDVVKSLNETYEQTGRSFRIEAVSGGFRVMTLPKFAPQIAVLHRRQASAKLSRASVETLAIIAYKQPITRAELEAIRGVSCGEVLKSLIDRRLVTIKGRAEELGRPMLYGTTKTFLDHFGLASVKDLPTLAELKPVS
jgi:segregation and condensation protein B